MKALPSILAVVWLACLPCTAAAPSESPLLTAARTGDRAALARQLRATPNPDVRDDAGNTPLILAAFCADADTVKALLRAGADLHATNHAGVNALHRAAPFHDKARLLVEAGANIHARTATGNTPLLLAARTPGNVATVRLLLDRGASARDTNAFGATALMAAVAAEDIASAQQLLDHGADPNATPALSGDGFLWGGGRTALGWAAFRGNEPLVKLLLARGARPDGMAIAGSALVQAGWAGHAGVARLLLDAGAPVDQRDIFANYTPLHWAASAEHRDPTLTELLLARGAQPNAEGGQPVDGFLGATHTPLQLALKRGETPIAQALRKAGGTAPAPAQPKAAATRRRDPSAVPDNTHLAAAIQAALPSLEKTALESPVTFQRHRSQQACISCHQQSLPLAALSLARGRRFNPDSVAIDKTRERTHDFAHAFVEFDLQSVFHPEPAIGNGYSLWSLRLAGQPASPYTDSLAHQLANIQQPDGSWAWNLPRPPIQSSRIGATALAIRGLKDYPIPGRSREFQQRIERARDWLAKARPEFTEERAYQLLGLAWAGHSAARLRSLADALVREQRDDGGWAQLPGLPTDAFATGQTLFALLDAARLPKSHPAIRKGVAYLLRTQLQDGTWHVPRRAFPFQPPMESGFPHGADGWISATASSWAVMALTAAIDPTQVPEAHFARLTSAGPGVGANGGAPSAARPGSIFNASVDFTRDIQPLLERSCVACHSGERPKGGFAIIDRESLLRGGNRGEPTILPGRPEASPLLRTVQDQIEDFEMPPIAQRGKFPALTPDQIQTLRNWIAQGAPWPNGVTLRPPAR